LEQLQEATDAYNAALEIDPSNAAARRSMRHLKASR
jgi:cytochrome c-type biogenesis protein CcmH/NrfG